MPKPLQEIYVTLFICPSTHLVKKWHGVNAVWVQGGCKGLFFFFSAVCNNRNCTSLWVDCASARENHLLINGVYVYGLDVSKTLNTEHHWKMKNFKVREDFFTGQSTYFLVKNKPVQHQDFGFKKYVLMQHFTKLNRVWRSSVQSIKRSAIFVTA